MAALSLAVRGYQIILPPEHSSLTSSRKSNGAFGCQLSIFSSLIRPEHTTACKQNYHKPRTELASRSGLFRSAANRRYSPPQLGTNTREVAMASMAFTIGLYYGGSRGSRHRCKALGLDEPPAKSVVLPSMSPDFVPASSSRATRLKDVVFVKEMRAAITSGEFALRLGGGEMKGLIDYQGLCDRLCKFAEKLHSQPPNSDILSPSEATQVLQTLEVTRMRLEDFMVETALGENPRASDSSAKVHAQPDVATATNLHASQSDASTVELPDPGRLLLYLRDDQMVDFDGALNGANRPAQFSRDLWERLNGCGLEDDDSEEDTSNNQEAKSVTEKAALLEDAKTTVAEMKAERDGTLGKLMKVAKSDATNTFQRQTELLSELRESERVVREWEVRVLLANIELLLERCAVELETELERTSVAEWDVSGKQLKLLVVEFCLLDKQVLSYWRSVPHDPSVCMGSLCVDLTDILDRDELLVLEADIMEFVTRLGLNVESDRKQSFTTVFQGWLTQLERTLEKTKVGLLFYTNGSQLLLQDLQYARKLFSKAALSNYTLKSIEVRTLQRTVKDLATLVPFLVILIIPMTPVGHVLVFSFIQKFFPDFFPSTFTERRQNMVKIYRDISPNDSSSDRKV